MTHRARKYFEKQKEFKTWKRDWINLAMDNPLYSFVPGRDCIVSAAFPRMVKLEFSPEFTDRIEAAFKKFSMVVRDAKPPAFIADYRHRSHIEEMAMLPLQLPAPVIRHMDFQVNTNEMWKDAVRGLGVPLKYIACIDSALPNPPIHIVTLPTKEDPYPLPFMKPMLLSPYHKTYEEALAPLLRYFLGDIRDRHPVTMERLDDE